MNHRVVATDCYPNDAMLLAMTRCLYMSVCLSVCLSVTSRSTIELTGWIEPVLAWRQLSANPTLCYNDIQVS